MTQFHYEHLLERIRSIKPTHRFNEQWVGRFEDWQSELREQLLTLLGNWPQQVDPNPQWETLEQRDGYTLKRVRYQTEPGLQTFALVGIPAQCTEPTPATLCLHGHGKHGALPVMAWGDVADLQDEIDHYQYDFGHRFAQAGLIAFAPNLRGFGPRLTEKELEKQEHRDTCDVNFFQQMAIGEVAVTSQIHDMMVAVNLLEQMEEVDKQRIGCAGLSYGGRSTMYLSMFEPRIKAAVVAGAINSFHERIASYATCGYQIIPGMLRHCDVGDMLGLIAPRPLAMEMGSEDSCSPRDSAMREFEQARTIYEMANASDAIELFEFEGGHVFEGTQSIPWLVRMLREA